VTSNYPVVQNITFLTFISERYRGIAEFYNLKTNKKFIE
jgi:hypothetical protein